MFGWSEGNNIRKRTEYLVDPNQAYAQVLEEWGSSGTATGALGDETLAKTYIFGDDLISQTKLALDGTGTNSFYHYDGLGTTRALSNTAGLTTDRNAYTAFGENDPAGTSGWTSGTTDNNFKYTGEQLDPNLGFYYLRARYMNPAVGGFINQDSYMGNSSDPASLHKYLYAGANPVMGIDPSGNMSLIELSSAQNIQSFTSHAALQVGKKSLKVKIFNIYLYFSIKGGFHSYIFAENKLSPGAGFRFDVGIPGGWGPIRGAPFSSHNGSLIVSSIPPRRLTGSRVFKAAELNMIQYLLWRGALRLDAGDELAISYNLFLGVNCFYWSVKASLYAGLIDRLKIGG